MNLEIPKVSVIIPLYNRAKFIPQLFKTLENQTFQNFEVILVDDGSTDDTSTLIKHFSKTCKQAINYLSQQNAGPYSARNHGLSVAKGEYIAFQDSDDEWPEYHLEDFVAALDANHDIDWIFGSLCRIDHISKQIIEPSNFVFRNGNKHPFITLKTEKRAEISVITDSLINEVAISYCVPGSTQCALIRKSLFDNNIFNSSYRTAYDRFFAISCVMKGFTFAFVEKTHQLYHIHDSHISLVTGVTPEKLEKSANTMLKGYSELLTLAKTKNERILIKKQLARVFAWELSHALKEQGRFKESTSAMFAAWKLDTTNWRYGKSYLVSIIRQILPQKIKT